ncbi:MAG: tRNA guanosine(34) transglycosylase Tgt [Planctomycetaceae bacterium]|nr:tRNA guanosine(34) transglycosylase Tgt [Planctomycetaceae bacterium]
MFSFQVDKTDGRARAGVLATDHGQVSTPVFMAVGTAGTVKGVTPGQLRACGVQMVLGNTYHLLLRPGPDTVAALGGLHTMMAWDGPILTDSGGYQVFSLAHLRKIDDQCVTFRSHIDGSEVMLTPRRAIEVQQALGADIIMQLDECAPGEAAREQVTEAVRRSALWAQLCKEAWLGGMATREAGRHGDAAGGGSVCSQTRGASSAAKTGGQALFGIQQGGVHLDLRAESAARLVELDLPGYAIGGLSVGEGHEPMVAVLEAIHEQFPADRPRYLMGVGEPRDILAAVLRGVDMFDCVLPTRNARNAQAFTWGGRMRLRNARYANDRSPLDAACDCYTCANFSRGTIRHLFMAGEMLGPTLMTIHNLHFFSQFMAAIRGAIVEGNLELRARQWLAAMEAGNESSKFEGRSSK